LSKDESAVSINRVELVEFRSAPQRDLSRVVISRYPRCLNLRLLSPAPLTDTGDICEVIRVSPWSLS
jgi:hypothetical protein